MLKKIEKDVEELHRKEATFQGKYKKKEKNRVCNGKKNFKEDDISRELP